MSNELVRRTCRLPTQIADARRLPCLDGWRAVAIALVIVSHSTQTSSFPGWEGWRWLPDGVLGVEIFFVISGFLITTLLLREHDATGSTALANFYIRRALRIMPVYAVFLAVLFILNREFPLHLTRRAWIGLATYTVNFLGAPWTAGHVWSLSVEEQFYVVWPVTFLLVMSSQKKWPAYFAVALPIVFCPVARTFGYLLHGPMLLKPTSFFCCSDTISVGCLTALILFDHGDSLLVFVDRWFGILVVVSGCLLLTFHTLPRMLIAGFVTVPFAETGTSIAIAFWILASVLFPKKPIFRWLQWGPLEQIGVLSYSLYLWQQIFCTTPQMYGISSSPWFLAFPGWIVVSLLVAWASYRFIEQPFLQLKGRFSSGKAH